MKNQLINVTYTTTGSRNEKTRGFIRPLSQTRPTHRGVCRMIVKAISDENPDSLINEVNVFPSRIETMIYQ